MKKNILYFVFYIIIIYEVYFISHYLVCLGGFGGAGYTLVYWIFHFILFCFLQYKFLIFEKSNKIISVLLIIGMSILPIYFSYQIITNSSPRFEYKLNEIGAKLEKYRKRNGNYPKSLDKIISPLDRFISLPYYLLPFPKYQYKIDSTNQTYEIRVYEDWDGGHMISSKYKKARWFE